jgi:hypothetical protein
MPRLTELRESHRHTYTSVLSSDMRQSNQGEELLVVDERSRLSRSGVVEQKLIRLTEQAKKFLASAQTLSTR